MTYKRTTIIIIQVLFFVTVNKVFSQDNNGISKSLGLYVFPSNNQSADQQAKDEMDCFTWAKNQTGIDPLNPPKVQADQVEKGPDGSAIKGKNNRVINFLSSGNVSVKNFNLDD